MIIDDLYNNREKRIYTDTSPTLRSERVGLKCIVEEPIAYDEQNGYIRNDGTVGTLTTDGSSPKHNNRVIEYVNIKQATKSGYIRCKVGGDSRLFLPRQQDEEGESADGG